VGSRSAQYRSPLEAHGFYPVSEGVKNEIPTWLLIEVKGGERTVQQSARAATFDLLPYRTAFAAVLDRQQAPFGLGIAHGAGLPASPTADVMLCTPDTLAAALERFLA